MPPLRPLFIFALFFALTPIWITHREMWDGVTIEYAFSTGDLSGLIHAVNASGWPLGGWIYKTFWGLQKQLYIPYWFSIDVLFTVTLLGMAYEIFQLSHQRLGLQKRLSTAVLILFLAQPVWHFLMSGIHVVHMAGFWFLLIGHRLTSKDQMIAKLAGWTLVTLSFQFPASIVMIFWLEWVLYIQEKNSHRRSIPRAVFVALYAVAWYAASRTAFGPMQTFGGYNQLLIPTSIDSIRMIIWTGLKFASWIAVLSAPLWIGFAISPSSSKAHLVLRADWVKKLVGGASTPYGIAVVGCFLAIVPYWAVGKGPVVIMPYDWTARNALPLAIPMSLLIALLIEKLSSFTTLQKNIFLANRLLALTFVWWLAMSFAGLAGKLYQIKLEKAIEASLRQLPPPPSGLVTLKLPFDPLIRMRQNEANGMFWRAYGEAKWAVLVGPPESWVRLIRDIFLGDQPGALKNVSDFPLWTKFMVMGELKSFSCETTINLALPDHEKGYANWFGWSPLSFNATLEKTSCP